jgi:UDP-N-acetylmuramate--alanine ligase
MIFQPGQHIHIVGIGGFGMSAIARVLLERGLAVSGSDRVINDLAFALETDGAQVFTGHSASNIAAADLLIVSSAIPDDNPEIVAARQNHIPIYKRFDVLSHLMAEQRVIAVAGTHGKTTTTAMITHLMQASGTDPSYIVGGVMANTGTNAGNGTGDTFVIEADEYDNAFLGLYPEIAIVTNIEWDHPDFFKQADDLRRAFDQFVARLPQDHGVLLACADDDGARDLIMRYRHQKRLVFTYGIDAADATLTARNISETANGATAFDVVQGGIVRGRATLRLPGHHNILNALAALYAAGPGNDLALADVIPHLATFLGTGRRFELRDDIDGIAVVDDYAHHPTAIRATLAAARSRYPGRQLWAVWQPHTYTRTRALWDGYVKAFTVADHVLITDIYAAREQPLDGIDAATIAAAVQHPDVRYRGTLEAATAELVQQVTAEAVIVIMSAGTAPQIGVQFLNQRGLGR